MASCLILAASALLVLAVLVFAQQTDQPSAPPTVKSPDVAPPPAPPPAEEKKVDEEPVYIENADEMYCTPDKDSTEYGVYALKGHVHLRQKDAHLYCDQAEYTHRADNDTARATGHLKLTTPESAVTGDLITADFGKKVADITGNVRLETQRKKAEEAKPAEPKPGETPPLQPAKPAEAAPAAEKVPARDRFREKLTVVTCEHIQYFYDEKRAIATGNVVGVQEDKTCYADEGVYIENDKEETLTLTGKPVRLVMKNGNTMETPKVKIDLVTEQMWTDAVTGVFKREKKHEGAAAPAPAPAGEAPKPPAGQGETTPKPPAPKP